MSKQFISLVGAFVLAAFCSVSIAAKPVDRPVENPPAEKMTICHVDPDTGEQSTITVPAHAVAYPHIAEHGDTPGDCVVPE
ncbi:MAG: hypothetical protein OEU36_22490 [Gammaproteobacteria bacterium]|nr:hypothetical protein [Gammaproteobacteria bacterium]